MHAPRRGRRRLLLPLTAALVLLSLAVVACGGDDTAEKNDYVDEVNKAQNEFADSANQITNQDSSDPEAFQRSLDDLDPALTEVVKDLENIEPPEEVKGEHDQLTNSLREYRNDLNTAKGDLSGDTGESTEAAQQIVTASQEFSTEFDRLINEINRKLQG